MNSNVEKKIRGEFVLALTFLLFTTQAPQFRILPAEDDSNDVEPKPERIQQIGFSRALIKKPPLGHPEKH